MLSGLQAVQGMAENVLIVQSSLLVQVDQVAVTLPQQEAAVHTSAKQEQQQQQQPGHQQQAEEPPTALITLLDRSVHAAQVCKEPN